MIPPFDNAFKPPVIDFPDMRPYWHQLLVIGNGFDLECRLPSKFSDFMNPRREILHKATYSEERLPAPWGIYLRDKGLTAWDMILDGEDRNRWNDVEGVLSSWVNPQSEEERYLDKVIKLFRTCKEELYSYPSETNALANASPQSIRYLFNFIRSQECFPKALKWNESQLLDYLLEELHAFERAFEEYLVTAVKENGEYYESARQLYLKLLDDERKSSDDYRVEGSVLSFNYTLPPDQIGGGLGSAEVINVHGKLGEEVVFGIDGTSCMDNPSALKFTKTYRLMGLENPDLGMLVWPYRPGSEGSATSLIKFYGHSLSEPDYAYFQALFDSVNLYEGDTRLIFYYRPESNDEDLEGAVRAAREDMMGRVTKLLVTYGATMQNSDHGKNLIHKLLLEGRLSVKPLPGTVEPLEDSED